MTKYRLAILFFFVCLIGCDFGKLYEDKDLGGGYYYFEDGIHSSIIYSITDGKSGFEVVEPIVKELKYNKEFIFVKKIKDKTGATEFWVINKSEPIKIRGIRKVSSEKEKLGFQSLLRKGLLGPFDLKEINSFINKHHLEISEFD